MKIKIIFLFCLFCLNISGAMAQKLILKISSDLESTVDSFPWTNKHTARKGIANSGEYYSSTDSVSAYGFGYKGAFPTACQGKNLKINFSEFVRVSKTDSMVFMVVTVSAGDSVISWTSKNVSGRIKSAGEWTKIEDAIEFPSILTGPDYTLAVYLWNSDGKAVVDIDDLSIEFFEKPMPSFLPAGFSVTDEKEGWQKMAGNDKVNFYYNKYSGQVKLLNEFNDTLISALAYYSEWYSKNKKEKHSFWNYRFNLQKDSVTEEGVYYVLNSKNDFSENKLLILAGGDGNLSFSISTAFISQVNLLRHSLITDFIFPVTEVFKKSTLTDTTSFSDEYWLGKEGFSFSNKRTGFILYRPKVSSVQLDVKNTCAVFNLEYSADHPLLYFPLLKKSEGKFEDRSYSVYGKGEILQSDLIFQSVKSYQKMAKIMSNPYGYEASFIWTEHADYTNLRTHKAVYLGADTINNLNDATGGFLRNSIPVTKSIFYSNPDKVDNADKAGFMKGPVATYKETEGFADFIRLLYETGNEICLHTPDHFTCDRKLLGEALERLKREFPSTSWIDHGYDNSIRSNREDLACDGADSTSKWYAADLWKKYGIKYFWNSFYEDSAPFKDYAFNSFFSVPYSGWDDAFPTPLYWRNKSRTGDIVHWRTSSTLDPADGTLWSYYFNDLRLKDVINNRDNVIIHCYPARVDSTNGFYVIKDNVVTVNDEFNKALKKLSYFRQEERLRLTTIQGLLDHMIAAENVRMNFGGDGKIIVRNEGRELIKGLSFSTKASEVKTERKEITTKKSGDELIFWFDISPGEVVTLILK